MKHIFYFLTLFPILWEMINLYNPRKVHNFISSYKSIKGKSIEDYTLNQKSFTYFNVGYLIWTFIGLFSFQWVLFIFLFALGLIPKKIIVLRWIDGLVSFLILVFIILNAYHLHIDVSHLVMNYFIK